MKESFSLIIFGASGNLAQIKLIPAIYDILKADLVPADFSIIGISRSPYNKTQIHEFLHVTLHKQNIHHKHEIEEPIFNKIKDNYSHIDGDLTDINLYKKLQNFLESKSRPGSNVNRIFYLATYPQLYGTIFENLKKVGLTEENKGWVRLMIEKPIGTDEKSASVLNKLLLKYFSENQIFRLDHYLGKETLQNILTFRFGNGVFEHLMDAKHVDHIQIFESENIGVGLRGRYFDTVGFLKDVGQNHILQMYALTTMEMPKTFSNSEITKKRIQAIKRLKFVNSRIIYGQYKGYKNEPYIDSRSKADTYFALKAEITKGKFKGVPVYIRAGKKLANYITEVNIVFKPHPKRLFKHKSLDLDRNVLTYRIFPNEGIALSVLTKVPGHGWEIENSYMQFCFNVKNTFLPDPYERLIVDAFHGDQTFFVDAPEVSAQWRFIDPLTKLPKKIYEYKAETWGPKEADKIIEDDGRKWIVPSPLLCRI